MKIGIITWYKGNIGSTLQAYALSTVLVKMGFEAEFIDIRKSKRENAVRRTRNILFHILFHRSAITRDNTYKFVQQYMKESIPISYNELTVYSERFSAFICGSDQIWSCINSVDPVYFLQFVEPQKRIAYAPSIGINDIKDEFKGVFSEYVKSIPYISVREDKGAEIIKDITGTSAQVVLDPTFLLRKKEWNELAIKSDFKRFNLQKGKYIFCYYLDNYTIYDGFTRQLEKLLGIKTIYVSFKKTNFGKKQVICTIEEFLSLINNAYCVLTDSFHGTVLSMNFGKKVAVFKRFKDYDPLNQNSRLFSVLRKFKVEDWIVSPEDDPQAFIDKKVNEEELQKRIEIERIKSMRYLMDCFESLYLHPKQL